MALFLFLTALVQGADSDAVMAIRVEGCGGKGLHELKPEILSILMDVSGETNLTWGQSICEKREDEKLEGGKLEGEKREGEKREDEKREDEKLEGGKPMGEKREGEKREDEKLEGEKLEGEKREGGKREGGKPMGEKREGGKPMGEKREGGKREGEKREGGKPMGEKREGAMLFFVASEDAAARLETPESVEQLQARVCELLEKTAANETKNATEPCVVAVERPQCDADGFPMIAVSGIAGAAVVLVAFVTGVRSIRRRRSKRVVKTVNVNDLETGVADTNAKAAQSDFTPSKTRESDLISEASTTYTAQPTTVTAVAGGSGAPTVARSALPMV